MHKQEPVPPQLAALAGFTFRVLIGAILGFVCAVVIIAADSMGTAFSPDDAFNRSIATAWKTGGLLGAIYLPLASALFLPKQNQGKMLAVAFVAAIVFGVAGDAAVGPWAPASVSASLGFWFVVFALYRHAQRSRLGRGRGTYLP